MANDNIPDWEEVDISDWEDVPTETPKSLGEQETVKKDDGFISNTLNKVGQIGEGLINLPGAVATGVAKVAEDPKKYLPEVGTSLIHEGLPFTKTAQQGTAGVLSVFDSVLDTEDFPELATPEEKTAYGDMGWNDRRKLLYELLQRRAEKVDPEIRPLGAALGMATPTGAASKFGGAVMGLTEAGVEGYARTGDLSEAAEDMAALGVIQKVPTAVGVGTSLVKKAGPSLEGGMKAMAKIPGRLMRKESDTLNRYYEAPEVFKSASLTDDTNLIASLGDAKRADLANAKDTLSSAKESFNATKQELADQRSTQLDTLQEQTRNVPPEAVDELIKGVTDQRKKLENLSKEQARMLDETGTVFNIRPLKDDLLSAVNRKGLPVKDGSAAQNPNIAKVSALATELPDNMTATQLLTLRQTLGDLGFKNEVGKPGSKAAYHQINSMLDDASSGIDPTYANIRSQLSDNIALRKTVKPLENSPEKRLASLGERNDAPLSNLIDRLDNAPDIRSKLSDYLKAKQDLKSLRNQPVKADASQVKSAADLVNEKAKAAAEFPYDQTSAQRLIEDNFAHRKLKVGKDGKLEKVAQELGDTGLVQRVEDIGYRADMERSPISGSRSTNLGRAVGGTIGSLIGGSVGGPIGATIGAGLGAMVDVSPMMAAGLPLDVARQISKATSKTVNSTAAKTINDAFKRGGPKSVQTTHFLLTLTNPEYRQATMEDE